MSNFKEIAPNDFGAEPFKMKSEWMLITAEKDGKVNTMTVSGGGYGVMWDKNVIFIIIRPQRYTKEFVDGSESFSLTFFNNKEYKKQLAYLGKVSGRDENKIENAGLTVAFEDGVPYFEEAEKVFIVKKLYIQQMVEDSFLDKTISDKWFPKKDFHMLYIAQITKALVKE